MPLCRLLVRFAVSLHYALNWLIVKQTTTTYDEALRAASKYYEGNETAACQWIETCALKDASGHLPEAMPEATLRRCAGALARIESKYPNPVSEEEIFGLLYPAHHVSLSGPMLAGLGNPQQSAPISDAIAIGFGPKAYSYHELLQADDEEVYLLRRGVALGHDLSRIYPAQLQAEQSERATPDVVSALERYARSRQEVARLAACAPITLSLSIKHPDAEAFINAGARMRTIAGVNCCLLIDDDFMYAVAKGENYRQQFPIDAESPRIATHIEARRLWEKLLRKAMRNEAPEIQFVDNILKEQLTGCYAGARPQTLAATQNATIPLATYDSSRLLTINLYSYVEQAFSNQAVFDHKLFRRHLFLIQRLADDLVDIEEEKIEQLLNDLTDADLPEEAKKVEQRLWEKVRRRLLTYRPTSLLLMGEAETLAALGLSQDTPAAGAHTRAIKQSLAVATCESTVKMAEERGAFSDYDAGCEAENSLILRLRNVAPDLYDRMLKIGRRNLACTIVTPNKPAQQAESAADVRLKAAREQAQEYFKEKQPLTTTPLEAQGINRPTFALPETADESMIAHCYFATWKSGYQSCHIQIATAADVLATGAEAGQMAASATAYALPEVVEHRPYSLDCDVVRFQNNKEKWVAFVGLLDGRPYEIFTGLQDDDEGIVLPKSVTKGRIIKSTNPDGSHRYDFQFENRRGYKTTVEGLSEKFNKEYWNYAKLISGILRYRMPIDRVIKLISSMQMESENINTWKVGVERALKKYIADGTLVHGEKCPHCGLETLIYSDGGLVCKDCGYARHN